MGEEGRARQRAQAGPDERYGNQAQGPRAGEPGASPGHGSWQLASQGLAALAAGTIGLVLSLLLDKADLAAWGWRVPFLLSLLLVPVGLYLRRMMPETLEKRAATAPSWGAALGRQVRLLVLAVLIILGGTVSTYVGIYMTTYAIATLHLPPSTALTATVVGGLATTVFALLGGWMSDFTVCG